MKGNRKMRGFFGFLMIFIAGVISLSPIYAADCATPCAQGLTCVSGQCVLKTQDYNKVVQSVNQMVGAPQLSIQSAGEVTYNPKTSELTGKFGTIKLGSFSSDYNIQVNGDKISITYSGKKVEFKSSPNIIVDKQSDGTPVITLPKGVKYDLTLDPGSQAIVIYGGKKIGVSAPQGGDVNFDGAGNIKVRAKDDKKIVTLDFYNNAGKKEFVVQSSDFYYSPSDAKYGTFFGLYNGKMLDLNRNRYFESSGVPSFIYPDGRGDIGYIAPGCLGQGIKDGCTVVSYSSNGIDITGPLNYGAIIGDYSKNKYALKSIWQGSIDNAPSINNNYMRLNPRFPYLSEEQNNIRLSTGLFKLNVLDPSGNTLYDFNTNVPGRKSLKFANEFGVSVTGKDPRNINFVMPTNFKSDYDKAIKDGRFNGGLRILDGNVYMNQVSYQGGKIISSPSSQALPFSFIVNARDSVATNIETNLKDKLNQMGNTMILQDRFIMKTPFCDSVRGVGPNGMVYYATSSSIPSDTQCSDMINAVNAGSNLQNSRIEPYSAVSTPTTSSPSDAVLNALMPTITTKGVVSYDTGLDFLNNNKMASCKEDPGSAECGKYYDAMKVFCRKYDWASYKNAGEISIRSQCNSYIGNYRS